MNTYTVNKIKNDCLNISGENMHPVWNMADVNTDFNYPWEDCKAPLTTFRALYDDENFYFRFDVEDENVLTFIDQNHKMEVVDSDRVEIFFRRDKELNPYYCLEMDAHARVLDYVANYYRKFDFNWAWPEDQLKVKASKNNKAYVVEGWITLSSLKELGILNNNVLEAGLYRGYCMDLPLEDKEADLRWISWVKPDAEEPDFHIPSSFGKLILK